jgi:hypothetical protein
MQLQFFAKAILANCGIFLLGLAACTEQRGILQEAAGWQVEISNLETKKTDETRYNFIGTKGVTYEVSARVRVASKANSGPGGVLQIRYSETTGFNDFGDRIQDVAVFVVNGEGLLKIALHKGDIEISDPYPPPPKISFKSAYLEDFEGVILESDRASTDSRKGGAVRLEASPLAVVKSANGKEYRAVGDLQVTALGELRAQSFRLWLRRKTVDHENKANIGDVELTVLPVEQGSGRQNLEMDLGRTKDWDGKDVKQPLAPKYTYEIMGITRPKVATIAVN